VTPQPIFICTTPGFQIIEETQTIAASWLGDVLGPASLRDAAADEALGLLPVLRRPGCTDQRVPGAFPDIRQVDGAGPAGHPRASVVARRTSGGYSRVACRPRRHRP